MTTPTIHCGVIGTGAFARHHAEAITTLSPLTLAAVCDTDAKRLQAFSTQWGGSAFENFHALLGGDSLDIMAIVTPDHTHASIIKDILEHPHAPRLIVVEKPLCISQEELQTIEHLLREHETRIVVNHSRRFSAGFQRLQDLISSEELGKEILSVQCKYYAGWLHNGVHVVDTLRMLLGKLTCSKAKIKCVDRYPEDPLLDVELHSKKFPNATIVLEGVPEDPYALFEVEIFLSQGRIRIHWDDVFIDSLRKGYSNAPMLQFDQHYTVESSTTALKTLYVSCSAFLHNENTDLFDRAGFDTARGTMEILFSAKSQANL